MADRQWVLIDGEEYEEAEAEALKGRGLVESCPHAECPHHYHKREGITDETLAGVLERIRLEP